MAVASAYRTNDFMEESIYNLIPTIQEQATKGARHKSKFSRTVRQEYTSNKTTAKTMGPPKVETQPPSDFLKKRSKEPMLPEKKTFKYSDEDTRRPPVPNHTEKPLMGIRSNKNFITTNAVENIMSVPKKPEKKFVDTRVGAAHPLTPSGLTPKYTQKKEYGKSPAYLERRKAEVERAQREYEQYVHDKMQQGAMRQVTGSERQAIIDGLKKNWEELHHQYQGLSVVTDTAPKKARKERMETEMKQLERDIETVEKHRIIYIAKMM